MMKITFGQLRRLVREGLTLEAGEPKPITADQTKELLKKFPKGVAKLGIKDVDGLQQLGSTGTHGTAFDLGDKVLKVTDDEREAKAASALVGKDVKGVVNFYGVWSLGNTGAYAILQEKLLPINASEAKSFNDALVTTAFPLWAKRAGGSWDKVKALTKDYVKDTVKKKFKSFDSPEAKEFIAKANEQWNLLVKKYGVKELFETLTELGIEFSDYHAGNMMKREDGMLVLIDLGQSKVGKAGTIQTITQQSNLQ